MPDLIVEPLGGALTTTPHRFVHLNTSTSIVAADRTGDPPTHVEGARVQTVVATDDVRLSVR